MSRIEGGWTRALSRWVGRASRVPSSAAARLYARAVGADLTEAEAGDFPSVAALFGRRLAPGARPLGGGAGVMLSPADGRFQGGGPLEGGGPPLVVKGQRLPWRAFLADAPYADAFISGTFFSVYLSPRDYHRVHAPVAGTVIDRIHVPGALYPVNALGTRLVSDLFVRNERVLVRLQTPDFGQVVVAFVGATNVGSIRLAFDPELKTNRLHEIDAVRTFDALSVERGDELGRFELGSTVVVMTEAPVALEMTAGARVLYGARLGVAPPNPSSADGGDASASRGGASSR